MDLSKLLITPEQEQKIKNKLPNKMPLNATQQGWSGRQIQKFFSKVLLDTDGSLFSEIKTKMKETKLVFEDLYYNIDDVRRQLQNISGLDEEAIANILDRLSELEQAESHFVGSEEPEDNDVEIWIDTSGAEVIDEQQMLLSKAPLKEEEEVIDLTLQQSVVAQEEVFIDLTVPHMDGDDVIIDLTKK